MPAALSTSFSARIRTAKSARSLVLFYQNATSSSSATGQVQLDATVERFKREAAKKKEIDEECVLTIHGNQYNMTAWANAHPGGAKILQKFHNRDASKAFEAAHHSADAYAMLKDFLVNTDTVNQEGDKVLGVQQDRTNNTTIVALDHDGRLLVPKSTTRRRLARLRHKLFTREDPIGIHKYLGVFCLINFIGRFRQMLFGDPAAGLGTAGHPWFAIACLIPHGVLSLSSLIFETVPKERVVGKPMIWQEYRVHNILFGVRSVLSSLAAALAIRAGNGPKVRLGAILFCGACVLGANYGADVATAKLRVSQQESTTATMPYWDGCSIDTQLRFKGFYAYCQFMATLACLAVGNPAWGLAVLLAIQLASLLMTLVRKGLLSARGYHYGYTTCLVLPWFVGVRSFLYTRSPEFPLLVGMGYGMYKLRRRGVNKYLMWATVILARVLVGDQFISYAAW